jgi:hypothetical protein
MLAIRTILLCSSLGLLACGGGAPKGPTPEQKAAEAKKVADDAAADAKALAERKAKREADDAKQAEADKKIAEEIERLTALPEKLPKDPVAACEAVGKAQDEFVRRTGDAKVIEAWDAGGKDKALPMTIVQCTQADSVKTAACQKAAFDGAGPELKDQSKKLMQVCIDKFANKKAPPTGMPQRRPG